MNSVVTGEPYIQKFPIDSESPEVSQSIDASVLWQKSFMTHGNVQNRVYCFGIQSVGRVLLIVMQIMVLKLSQQIPVERFPYARMTVAVCWL